MLKVRIETEYQQWPDDGQRIVRLYAFDNFSPSQPVGSLSIGELQKPVPWIYGLFVNPKLRRKGIARALMQAAIAECKEQKKMTLVLWVNPKNKPAQKLYQSLGFIQVSWDAKKDWQMALPLR